MWTGALSAIPASGGLPVGVRLTPAELDEVVAAIGEALLDTELTVEELGEAVVASTGPWAGELLVPAFGGMWPRWRIALPTAAARGALCFGAGRGRAVTYVNPIRWLPGFRPEPATAAAGWLLRSYLRSFGPATPAQFARWLAAPVPWAADLFRAVADELAAVDASGTQSWILADDLHAQPPEPRRGVRLLPYFDSYVVGSHPRELLFPGPAAARALSRTGQAGTVPVLLVDGVVGGIWHHRRSGRGVGHHRGAVRHARRATPSRTCRAGRPGRRDPPGGNGSDDRAGDHRIPSLDHGPPAAPTDRGCLARRSMPA